MNLLILCRYHAITYAVSSVFQNCNIFNECKGSKDERSWSSPFSECYLLVFFFFPFRARLFNFLVCYNSHFPQFGVKKCSGSFVVFLQSYALTLSFFLISFKVLKKSANNSNLIPVTVLLPSHVGFSVFLLLSSAIILLLLPILWRMWFLFLSWHMPPLFVCFQCSYLQCSYSEIIEGITFCRHILHREQSLWSDCSNTPVSQKELCWQYNSLFLLTVKYLMQIHVFSSSLVATAVH